MKKHKKRKMPLACRVIITLALLMILFFSGVTGMILIRENQTPKELNLEMNYDAIIVLGAQVKPDRTPSVQLSWRLDAAVNAYEHHMVPVVVCGAQGADEPMPEAEAMKLYLIEAGVPEEKILTDADSFNTRQNIENAKRLLVNENNVRSVLIVTSDYHVPRAISLARDAGLEAVGLGSPCLPQYWIKNHFRETLAWIKYLGIKYLRLPLE